MAPNYFWNIQKDPWYGKDHFYFLNDREELMEATQGSLKHLQFLQSDTEHLSAMQLAFLNFLWNLLKVSMIPIKDHWKPLKDDGNLSEHSLILLMAH